MSTVAVERVPLSELLGRTERALRGHAGMTVIEDHADQEPVLPFDAWRQDTRPEMGTWIPIVVTALMERTAAFHAFDDRYDTGVLRLDLVFVDAAELEWKPKVAGKDIKRRWNGAATPEQSVAKSDARALADQAHKRAKAEREESLRRASVGSVPEGKEAMSEVRHCNKCGKDKPVEQMLKKGPVCLDCNREYQNAYAAKKRAEAGVKPKAKAAKKTKAIPAETVPRIVPAAQQSERRLKAELNPLTQSIVDALAELEQLREFKRRILEVASA